MFTGKLMVYYLLGYQAGIVSDDWAVSSRPGTWDIQFDWEGTALQTEDWDGTVGSGQHHFTWHF